MFNKVIVSIICCIFFVVGVYLTSSEPSLKKETIEEAPVIKEPIWRSVWVGSDRYMKKDGVWHTWTPESKWVAVPLSVVERIPELD